MPPDTHKNSGADYPVDPAERVSQQQRLKKAAAAGANASKAPVPSFLSQLPSPTLTPTKTSEPAPASIPSPSNISAAIPEPFGAGQVPLDEKIDALPPNQNQDILTELRKISAWAEMQRKMTKGSLIVLAIIIPVLIGIGFWMEQRVQTSLNATISPTAPTWYEVDQKVRQGDFDQALEIGEALLLKTPQSPEAHQRLAGAYLASGKIEKAREHYAEAFRLFPSEENEKRLTAIEKRIKSQEAPVESH
jgi:hypothetical protein